MLEMPGASGLRPCTQTHLKKVLCHTRPVGGTTDKYRCILIFDSAIMLQLRKQKDSNKWE